jgi:NitT/TauT family transport system ATP-binding protein
MLLLTLKNVSKSFDAKMVLSNMSFCIQKGSFISIFGPNAAGKTTLLNLIAGLVKPDSGEINWGDEQLKGRVSYVFQNYRETLFPWKNVFENISLPLKLKGVEKGERISRVEELLNKFSLNIDLVKYPYQLSGGQQQLVAILRAVITEPAVLLLDEPFSALDLQKRLDLQNKILEIWTLTRTTIIFVSHDLEEAIYLADTVILLGSKPTVIVNEQHIEIDRPRDISILTSEKFTHYRNLLLNSYLRSNTL